MNSDAASDSAPVASDNAQSGETMQSEGDAADSGEMDADTADMNEANDGAMTADTGDMATEQPEGTYLASELTGEPVQNAEGEDLAGIEDFVIGQDGAISHVIVSFGGFLGLGDKEVMLPWDQFEITTDPEDEDDLIARLNMTEEEIEALPEFKSQEEVREETERQAEPATTGTATGTGTTGTATGTTGTTAQ
ncbi:PRC-barrel domain-containing protein [Amorphus coralli]|uniref:PRC-barrel domain-containing protein n=1 Tax=Amorphus coralli TaxID=340680 RepID=UPI0012EC4852|nr:PRC-barrel domain-containing protein [Amorphus coralli]